MQEHVTLRLPCGDGHSGVLHTLKAMCKYGELPHVISIYFMMFEMN